MIVILIISINLPFTIFTEALKNLREWYHLTLKPSPMTTETKNRKNGILNNVNQLYNKYFDTYKKNDCENSSVFTSSLINSQLSNSTFSKLANSAVVLGVFGTQPVLWFSLMHDFIHLSLNSDPPQVQTLWWRVGYSRWCGPLTMVLAGN